MKFNSITKNCLECGKEFLVWPSQIKKGRGKYCSKECQYKNKLFKQKLSEANIGNANWQHPNSIQARFKKGLIPWNKGKTNPFAKNLPQKFLKGHNPWNKGKEWPEMSGKNHPMWKGGIWHDSDGYIWLLRKEHPRANKYGYVLRSHLIAEESLNRLIQSNEIIHHINRIRNDDRPENLYLFSDRIDHRLYHILQNPFFLKSNLS